jgi:hypothetical protein
VFLGSVGFILKKSHSSRHKIVVLDKVQGKIECVTTTPSLSIGTLITYNIRQQRATYFISDSTLLYTPLSLARTDILFFHHVLELIYYFTHIGNCAAEVFDLLAFLYSTEHVAMTKQCKKIFLLKLLTCMGSVPEFNDAHTAVITQLNAIKNGQLSNTIINAADEKIVDRWLWCCVWQHPYVNEFKTVHFLAENRTI